MKTFSFVATSAIVLAAFAGACSASKNEATAPTGDVPEAGADGPAATSYPVVVIGAEPQRPGDPAKGYRALVNEAYVPCGIPYSAYSQVYGPASAADTIPGREGRNATLAYDFTSMTTKEGVELVTSNCLTCHAGRINGKLVVGLGAADRDFTTDAASQIQTTGFVGALLTDPKERAEWTKWKERVDTVAPYSVLSTRGVNPADGFTAVLFAHHDPKTMAWSQKPLIAVPPPQDVPVDVPPWWGMKKKTSMFYVGGGRGDHARIMMTASILCTSSVEESRAIDAYFTDVRSWIASLAPPAYPFPIDRALADRGRGVFDATCSRCHGTYGDGGGVSEPPAVDRGDRHRPGARLRLGAVRGAVRRLVQGLVLRRDRAARAAARLRGAAARRHLGDGALSAQRLGADGRGAPRQLAAARPTGRARSTRRTTTRPRSAGSSTRSITARKARPT